MHIVDYVAIGALIACMVLAGALALLDNVTAAGSGGSTQASIAYHHSANSPNATRQSLAISCCGCGSPEIFSNIALGYTAPTKKTAATSSGMSCLRFIWTGAARAHYCCTPACLAWTGGHGTEP